MNGRRVPDVKDCPPAFIENFAVRALNPTVVSQHPEGMALALEWAAKGMYITAPNLRIGCVIVRGGTAYVTLEPCSYHGRTRHARARWCAPGWAAWSPPCPRTGGASEIAASCLKSRHLCWQLANDSQDTAQRQHQPKSATASTAGGHTAERVEHSDIVIHKVADLAFPILMQNGSTGPTIPRARIEFLRADGQGTRIKYFEIELEDVLIGSVCPSVHEGSILCEHISLKYAKVRWRYTQQRVSGGSGGNTAAGWDLSSNRIAV